nr:MAG TPA: hypothetical protein [Bacteriophage sp.]
MCYIQLLRAFIIYNTLYCQLSINPFPFCPFSTQNLINLHT